MNDFKTCENCHERVHADDTVCVFCHRNPDEKTTRENNDTARMEAKRSPASIPALPPRPHANTHETDMMRPYASYPIIGGKVSSYVETVDNWDEHSDKWMPTPHLVNPTGDSRTNRKNERSQRRKLALEPDAYTSTLILIAVGAVLRILRCGF